MRLTISNYRRIERATIEVSPLALIAGTNEAGKTCLAQAARGALLQDGAPHPDAKKKDGELMVRRGAKSGEVVLAGEDGTVTIAFPKGKVAAAGDSPPRATVYGAGVASLCTLPQRTAADFAGYIDASPTKADLMAGMGGLGFTEKAIEYTWGEIEAHGWDEVAKTGRESATKSKGQWEAIAGEKWGEKKAEGWKPAGWSDDLDEDRCGEEALIGNVQEAKRGLEKAIGAGAVSQAERERLEAEVKAAPDAGPVKEALATRVAAADAHSEAVEKRAALPAADSDPGIPCPSCGTCLIVDHPYGAKKPTLKEARTVDEKEMKVRRLAIADADGTVSRLKGELDATAKRHNDISAARDKGEAAAKRLDEMGEAGATDEGAVAGARTRLESAEADLKAFRAHRDATKLHARIISTLALVDLLSPDGLRKSKLARGLGPWNSNLAELCEVAGWRRVWVDESLDIHMDQDPYWLLSESAQYRTRVILQIAQAMADGSDMVVIDGADILDQKGRNGLFSLLTTCSVPALVTMTASSPDKVPDLAAAGIGVTMWLADGVAEPLVKAEAA